MACLFLSACYWLIDVKGHRAWAMPFVVFGTNAIAAFFLSGLFARVLTLVRVADGRTLKAYVYETAFAPLFAPVNASLAYAICFVLLWLAIMSAFYRRRIFIKV
jgi:predicted acyltransferase